jgi:hypothetical protein
MVRTSLTIGACMVPTSFANSSSRLGMVASALTSLVDISALAIAPPLMTKSSLSLANSDSTLAPATGSCAMPYISGPAIWSVSFSNGVPLTARRASVFFSTRR